MYRLFVTYVLSLLFCSCVDRSDRVFNITYNVSSCMEKSYMTFISYKDTAGYVSFRTCDKSWSKEVCLPPGEIASLFVILQYMPNLECEGFSDADLYLEDAKNFVYGEIIHRKMNVKESNTNLIWLDLLPPN